MYKCENRIRRINMSVLATPKRNSYILKKNSSEKILSSRSTKSDISEIKDMAQKFVLNNLRNVK